MSNSELVQLLALWTEAEASPAANNPDNIVNMVSGIGTA
jgi:hypothetical protein